MNSFIPKMITLDKAIAVRLAELADGSNFGSLDDLQSELLNWSDDLRSGAQSIFDFVENDVEKLIAHLVADMERIGTETVWLSRARDHLRRTGHLPAQNRSTPHCPHCHCAAAEKGMVERSAYLDFLSGLMAVVCDSKSHAEAIRVAREALQHNRSK